MGRLRAPRSVARALTLAAASCLLLATAGPVAADKPVRGCPADKVSMSRDEFRTLSLSLGIPPELLFNPDWEAGWDAYDKNADTYLCVGDVPNTPGHLDTWIFNVTDNTSNH
jgi:hypothetical protein